LEHQGDRLPPCRFGQQQPPTLHPVATHAAPRVPAYETEPWVAVEKPEGLPWKDLLDLLRLYNVFILHLVRNLDPACLTNVWAIGGESKTLAFLARDYYRHLDWHLAHLETRIREIQALSSQ